MKNENTHGKMNSSSTDGNRCDNSRVNNAKNSSGNDLREIRNQGDMRDIARGGSKDRLS